MPNEPSNRLDTVATERARSPDKHCCCCCCRACCRSRACCRCRACQRELLVSRCAFRLTTSPLARRTLAATVAAGQSSNGVHWLPMASNGVHLGVHLGLFWTSSATVCKPILMAFWGAARSIYLVCIVASQAAPLFVVVAPPLNPVLSGHLLLPFLWASAVLALRCFAWRPQRVRQESHQREQTGRPETVSLRLQGRGRGPARH